MLWFDFTPATVDCTRKGCYWMEMKKQRKTFLLYIILFLFRKIDWNAAHRRVSTSRPEWQEKYFLPTSYKVPHENLFAVAACDHQAAIILSILRASVFSLSSPSLLWTITLKADNMVTSCFMTGLRVLPLSIWSLLIGPFSLQAGESDWRKRSGGCCWCLDWFMSVLQIYLWRSCWKQLPQGDSLHCGSDEANNVEARERHHAAAATVSLKKNKRKVRPALLPVTTMTRGREPWRSEG